MADSRREFVAGELWMVVAVLTVPIVSLVGLAGFATLSGALAIIGFLLLTPLFLFWGEEIADFAFGPEQEESEALDPVEELKVRYARGEIGEEEFERRVDRLLDVEGEMVARGGGQETDVYTETNR